MLTNACRFIGVRRFFWMLLVGILPIIGVACTGAQRSPRIHNHPPPDLHVEVEAFKRAGCVVDDSGLTTCPPESILGTFGCSYIENPSDYLGGLEPVYPLNLCWMRGRSDQPLSKGEYFYRDGCVLPRYVRYVVQRNGQFELIVTLADLQKLYAPITSDNEALSYALAATGLSAYYGLEAPVGYRYFVDQIEDTHVVATDNGYHVYLYAYKICGCGPHTTSSVEILVTTGGQVSEVELTPVFEDPEQDSLCID